MREGITIDNKREFGRIIEKMKNSVQVERISIETSVINFFPHLLDFHYETYYLNYFVQLHSFAY